MKYITEIIYEMGGPEIACMLAADKERSDYSKKIGVNLYNKTIGFEVVFDGYREVASNQDNNARIVELKNQFHTMVNLFGWDAAELISHKGIFGRAYYNALLSASKGKTKSCFIFEDEIAYEATDPCLPSAREIFNELSKLLKRCSYNGFIIDESVKKYM